MNTQWKVHNSAPRDWLEQFPEYNPIILQLLYNRGLETLGEIELFLSPDYSRHVYDPFLFRDMEKATERIWQAIADKQLIVIYGDYDADGVCSSTLLYDFLTQQGAQCEVILPHRITEGYGLNTKTLPHILNKKPSLVITVDCGSTSVAEIAELNTASIDVIVADHHHEPDEKPACFALLNCTFADETYPTKDLAAVGMTYKLVQGLIQYAQKKLQWNKPEGIEKWYLDLVAIATIADCVPLHGENRVLVKYGLMVLNKTKRPGLQALLHIAGIKPQEVTERHVGFAIAPRINAAGRMDHAYEAFNLLIAPSYTSAQTLAQTIQQYNSNRQSTTEEYIKAAFTQVESAVNNNDTMLFVYNAEWNIGIAGLVASRLVEKYKRPALVMTDYEDTIKGSGRSVKGFHITKALAVANEYLSHYGGHEQACGFTLQKKNSLDIFQQTMLKYANQAVSETDLLPELDIDAQLELLDITWELFEQLDLFAPFGQDAPKPLFVSKKVYVKSVKTVGNQNQHVRMNITDNQQKTIPAIGFGLGGKWGDKLNNADIVDIVFEIDVNEWNGNRELQLFVKDIQKYKS